MAVPRRDGAPVSPAAQHQARAGPGDEGTIPQIPAARPPAVGPPAAPRRNGWSPAAMALQSLQPPSTRLGLVRLLVLPLPFPIGRCCQTPSNRPARPAPRRNEPAPPRWRSSHSSRPAPGSGWSGCWCRRHQFDRCCPNPSNRPARPVPRRNDCPRRDGAPVTPAVQHQARADPVAGAAVTNLTVAAAAPAIGLMTGGLEHHAENL